jgi:hypothetical protein
MPAMLKDKGSCPVCGIDVVRLITSLHGRMRETYTCPDHGAVAYGAQTLTVAEWVESALPRTVAPIVV